MSTVRERGVGARDDPGAPASRALPVLRVLVYFVLVVLGVRILQEIFKEVSTTTYAIELSRLSGLAASNLDAVKNADDVAVTFFALSVAFLLVLPVAWVHMITHQEEPNAPLTQTLIMLCVIVAGVMLLLEDNLARSFSLVGVVAAVRFRNTLKDPKDAVYVFLSLGVGMACGLQAYPVALFLSFFECMILLVLWAYHTGAPLPGALAWLGGRAASAAPAPWRLEALPPVARRQLVEDLEAQTRYLAMAELRARKGGRRPNAVIAVHTLRGSDEARERVEAELAESRGRWRLLAGEDHDDVTVLEYLGRLSRRRTPPSMLLERLGAAHPAVRHVTFRSLRELQVEEVDAPGAEAGAGGVGNGDAR